MFFDYLATFTQTGFLFSVVFFDKITEILVRYIINSKTVLSTFSTDLVSNNRGSFSSTSTSTKNVMGSSGAY